MTTFLFYDAAYPLPPAQEPITNGFCIYCGGDTVHVWTAAEIAEQKASLRLPIWVRSNPGQVSATGDGNAMVAWLRANGCPTGVATVLDLETAVDAAYVNGYGAILHGAGYLVLPYGSISTLFDNPMLDGYFVANPTGVDHIFAGSVATQFAADGSYDLDDIVLTVPLWNTTPPPPAPPAPKPGPLVKADGGKKMYQDVTLVTDSNGDAWTDVAVPAGMTWLSCIPLLAAPGTPGITPATPANYDLARTAFTVGAAAGKVRVQITGGIPNGGRSVRVVFG